MFCLLDYWHSYAQSQQWQFLNHQYWQLCTNFVCSVSTIFNSVYHISHIVQYVISGGGNDRSYLAGISYSFDTSNSPFCAGSLISSQWILTTASCSYSDRTKTPVDKVNVVLGEETLGTPGQEKYKVKQFCNYSVTPLDTCQGCGGGQDHRAPQLLQQ